MSVYLKLSELSEAKSKAEKLISQLDSIPLSRMYQASFKANVRLQVFFTGFTHELFLEYGKDAQDFILRKATPPRPSPNSTNEFGEGERVLDGVAGLAVQSQLMKLWESTFKTWSEMFEKVRVEAASIPFGVMAVFHERLIVENVEKLEEGIAITEAVEDGVFSPQLDVVLNVASNYLYGDTLNLSQRIWQVDRMAQDGINAVLLNGISNGDSAWNIAQQLEQFLGAGAACPRWTSTRLYDRTKKDIASGDTTGLLRDDACDGSGVSYNALRLARTEIQKVFSLATDRMLAAQPWVEMEKVNLSPAHVGSDICDEVATGGEKHDGVYPVGTIELPLHPNCLDYKTAVLMDQKEFTGKLKGWLKGEQDWAEMDEYESAFSAQQLEISDSVLPNAINLAVWLFGEDLEKWLQ